MVCICLSPKLFTLLSQVLFLTCFRLMSWICRLNSLPVLPILTYQYTQRFSFMPHFSCVGCLFGLVDTDLCLRRFLHHSVKVLVLPASGWAFFWVWLGLLMVGCFFCFFFHMSYPSPFDTHFWTSAFLFTQKFSTMVLHFS